MSTAGSRSAGRTDQQMDLNVDPKALESAFDEQDEMALTPRSLFDIDYIAPPVAISDYVTTLFHFRCDESEVRDIQPASIGWLALFPFGKGVMTFADGREEPNYETNLLTPFAVATPFAMKGPVHSIGAALSPLGWAALTGLDAAEYGNRLVRAGALLADSIDEFGARLCEEYRNGEKSGADCAKALCDYIEANAKPVKPRHAELVRVTNSWLGSALNPAVGDLMEKASYSERQVQRLVERYFGLPPSALARKYRALRTAALLSFPMLTPEWEAEIGEAFYDQSHMIRELRLFVGRTPASLTDDDSPFLNEMIDPKNFRELG